MPKTANAFVPDGGDLEVTIAAGDVTAIAAFSTAEAISVAGVVRTFNRTNNPQRTSEDTKVIGDTSPINTASAGVAESEQYELVIVDDETDGGTGEWGTDNLTAVEIFREFFDANREISQLDIYPAGQGTGKKITRITDVKVLSRPFTGAVDADATTPATVTILLSASSHTIATDS